MNGDQTQSLAGLTVVVTRSASQASGLSDALKARGADVCSVTAIAFEAPADGGLALRQALAEIDSYGVVAVASPNGARSLLAGFAEGGIGPDTSLPALACVGPGTAAVLERAGFRVDIVANRSIAEGLVEAVGSPDGLSTHSTAEDSRLLLVQAEVSRPALEQGLSAAGWQVDRVVGYRTVDGDITAEQVDAARGADAICFMSSSSVERYVRLAGRDAVPAAVVTVGPITTATALEHGLTVEVEAERHTLDGLVDAIVAWAGRI